MVVGFLIVSRSVGLLGYVLLVVSLLFPWIFIDAGVFPGQADSL